MSGYSDNLHLHNLCQASGYEVVILPPMQTYYNHLASVQEMARHTAARILDQFGLEVYLAEWEGVITEHWAKTLATAGFCPAVVLAGIHYDGLDREEI